MPSATRYDVFAQTGPRHSLGAIGVVVEGTRRAASTATRSASRSGCPRSRLRLISSGRPPARMMRASGRSCDAGSDDRRCARRTSAHPRPTDPAADDGCPQRDERGDQHLVVAVPQPLAPPSEGISSWRTVCQQVRRLNGQFVIEDGAVIQTGGIRVGVHGRDPLGEPPLLALRDRSGEALDLLGAHRGRGGCEHLLQRPGGQRGLREGTAPRPMLAEPSASSLRRSAGGRSSG